MQVVSPVGFPMTATYDDMAMMQKSSARHHTLDPTSSFVGAGGGGREQRPSFFLWGKMTTELAERELRPPERRILD